MLATAAMNRVTRLLIFDNHAVVRADLRMIFSMVDGIEVVGEAADGADAIYQTERLNPDIVLIDLDMPGVDSSTAIYSLKNQVPAPVVYGLTMDDSKAVERVILHTGVDVIFIKGKDFPALVNQIKNYIPNRFHPSGCNPEINTE